MALTPGGGRSPSTKSPPPPPRPTGQPRPTPNGGRQTPTSSTVVIRSIVRWGLLLGGLIIIADLASRAIIQRTLSPDDAAMVGTLDDIANYVLFSLLGILVVRDTHVVYAGAIAGAFGALLDASVVAAAGVMAPTPGPGSVEETFILNLIIGTVFAGLGGIVYAVVRNWSGRRRQR